MADVIELVRKRDDPPPVNPGVVEMLRSLLEMAEAGHIQAAAVAYEIDGFPFVCFEADGHEALIATAARQIDDDLRAVLFEDE